MAMTRERLRSICKENDLYMTPALNDNLFCNLQGFTSIGSLEEYTAVKAIFLEGNALSSLAGLPPLIHLRCLYLQNNALDGLDGLDQLPNLETLNVSNNRLSQLPFMAGCPKLATFLGAHNDLSSAECIQTLVFCTALTTVDLQENGMADAQALEHLRQLPDLRCLYLKGNPVVSCVKNYRRTLIARLPRLTYLDDRPIFDRERRCAEAWSPGGAAAEQVEREEACAEEWRKSLAALRAPVDLQDDSDKEDAEPPELATAMRRLRELRAGREIASPVLDLSQEDGD